MDILKDARNELYLSMRFFDVALNRLELMPDTGIQGVGTDGFFFYFYPDYMIGLYKNDPIQINRAFLHTMLHCLFRHFSTQEMENQAHINIEETQWNLACDIVAESMIDDISKSCVRKYKTPYRKAVERIE